MLGARLQENHAGEEAADYTSVDDFRGSAEVTKIHSIAGILPPEYLLCAQGRSGARTTPFQTPDLSAAAHSKAERSVLPITAYCSSMNFRIPQEIPRLSGSRWKTGSSHFPCKCDPCIPCEDHLICAAIHADAPFSDDPGK